MNANSLKTHCKRNHAFTPANTLISSHGSRICLQCKEIRRHQSHKAQSTPKIDVKWFRYQTPKALEQCRPETVLEKVIEVFFYEHGHFPTIVLCPKSYKNVTHPLLASYHDITIRVGGEKADPKEEGENVFWLR